MEKKIVSLKELKKRKMLLILPILALPFITIIFWTLGGGKGNLDDFVKVDNPGFNIKLPDPKFKEDSALDKMSYYDQAAIDSLKFQDEIKNDPNYSSDIYLKDTTVAKDQTEFDPAIFSKGKTTLNTSSFRGQNEQKVYQKLKALQKAIAEPPKSFDNDQDMREFENGNSSDNISDDMKNLEHMMAAISAPVEPDPELKQLEGMLENILDIQHPQRIQEKLRQSSLAQKGKVFSVSRTPSEDPLTSFELNSKNPINSKSNSFYSLEENITTDEIQNGIEAVIHQTQSIINGSIVKLRLTSDVFINGVLIPRNSFLYGIAALKGERLEVKIDNIKFRNSIFPVSLLVYDMDGIGGIYIPGAISRDVAKSSVERSSQSLGIASLDDSWGAQAAGMGVEAAKTLLSKKVKLIKVVVKAGYQVLLYDEKQNNEK